MDADAAVKGSWLRTASPIFRAVAIAFAFVLLIAAAVVIGDTSTWHLSRAKRAAPADMKSNPNVGHLRIPLPDRKTCREMAFNRVTGQVIDTTDAPCAVPPELLRRAPGNFVWGGSK
jgi:hypothetical protein